MLEYRNILALAPMVRAGTLPLRSLSLKYGANVVYSEEIVDKKILRTTRVVNDLLGTIDYVTPTGTIVFQTRPSEVNHVVFQMGTAAPDLAVKAALHVIQDVAAIDVNMGCPKRYSTIGGMGAALLKEPEKVREILTALKECLTPYGKPVTCKIRLLDSHEETLKLVRVIESTGVSAIGLHGREKHERPREPAHWDRIKNIVEVAKVPIIANGDVFTHADIQRVKDETGVHSMMIARGALKNPSVFRSEPLDLYDAIRGFIKECVIVRNVYQNTKWVLIEIMKERMKSPEGVALNFAKSNLDICRAWGIESFYEEVETELKRKQSEIEAARAAAATENAAAVETNAEAVVRVAVEDSTAAVKSVASLVKEGTVAVESDQVGIESPDAKRQKL